MENSPFWNWLQEAGTICFAGDSLTEGTINGGVPWYEPLLPRIPGKVHNISQGGVTTKALAAYFLPAMLHAAADLYVVAAGANDILFRDPLFCAVTPEDYIQTLKKIRRAVLGERPGARFVFIAPWPATDGDASIIGGIVPPDTETAYGEYTGALRSWCGETGDLFIDAGGYIRDQFALASPGSYLLDFIHPNAVTGVPLYAKAVLLCSRGAEVEG